MWRFTLKLTAQYGVLLTLGERVIVRLFSAFLGSPSDSMNPIDLPFPLNVYGLTLALEFGAAEHLHFGVYTESSAGQQEYPEAQARAEETLRTLLPPTPARILEYGFGSGALAADLGASGYEVTALSPLAEECRARQNDAAAGVRYLFGELASVQTDEDFDVLLLQQSAQYLDPLQLLVIANACLKEGGQLLIADEFLLDDSTRKPQSRPLLANFLRLAQRCGFSAERQRDLGRQVAPGLVDFAQLLEKHAATLCDRLEISTAQLTQLRVQLEEMAVQYRHALLGYTLLDLRRGPRLVEQAEFGSIDSFGLHEVKPLFESSFETSFDEAVWNWKYAAGRGRAVCARQGGELVAHYGGAPRDILYFGETSKAIQICDVMVLPEYRSFVSRDTLFFKTAATFLEQQVGNCAEHLLGFGFPNQRVLRMARRLGLYDVTDSFIEIQYPVMVAGAHEEYEIVAFDLLAQESPALVDSLWTEMQKGLQGQIVGTRDWAYWHYRYCAHPAWSRGIYECVALRSKVESRIAALFLLRQQDERRLLMDIVGDVEQFPAYIEVLRDYLATANTALVCRTTLAQAPKLNLHDAHWHELEIEIPCNIWTRGPSAEQLQGAWWLTAGDMDFL